MVIIGQGGGRPGEKGVGGVRKAGEEGVGGGFPWWQEAGEKETSCATLCNILQSKKCKEVGANKYRAEPGLKGMGSGRFNPPVLPPAVG